MTYVFDDGPESYLSKLICNAYKNSNSFVFANGNTNVFYVVRDMINSQKDNKFICSIDVSPGNVAIPNIIGKLHKLNSESITVIVAPIICAEYYMLKVFEKHGLLAKKKFVHDILDIRDAVIDIGDKKRSGKKANTFEHRCKTVLTHFSTPCFNTSSEYYKNYALDVCCSEKCNCNSDLDYRALEYLSEFPYIPVNSKANDKFKISPLDYNRYVDRANEIIDMYNEYSKYVYDKFNTIERIDTANEVT